LGKARVQRRDFIALLLGVATTRAPALPANAQQPDRIRRIGVLMNLAADDPEGQVRLKTFLQELQRQGWTEGRNVRVDICWGGGQAERYRTCAAELVGSAPDVILAGSGAAMPALMEATHSLSIVFVQTIDPVGLGYAASLAAPGGNATGFTQFEFSMGGKWLELLKQIAPRLTRVVILRDAAAVDGTAQFAAIQSAAPSLGVELTPISVRDPSEIERGVTAFAGRPNGGLIVTGSPYTAFYRNLIIALAARHRLPAVFPYSYFITSGGLISYGPEPTEQFERAAEYVSRILNGEKPANLPVQAATKVKLVINLKTASALGLTIPPSLLARADEVIE
jgi:putative tryptophan/tyrosine transport system substrate-binding protein